MCQWKVVAGEGQFEVVGVTALCLSARFSVGRFIKITSRTGYTCAPSVAMSSFPASPNTTTPLHGRLSQRPSTRTASPSTWSDPGPLRFPAENVEMDLAMSF